MEISKAGSIVILLMGLVGCASSPSAPSELEGASTQATAEGASTQATAEVTEASAVANEAEVPKVASAGSPDDVICTREKVTGSHFSRKVCRTRGEIEAEREAHQRALDRVNSTGFGANSSGSN